MYNQHLILSFHILHVMKFVKAVHTTQVLARQGNQCKQKLIALNFMHTLHFLRFVQPLGLGLLFFTTQCKLLLPGAVCIGCTGEGSRSASSNGRWKSYRVDFGLLIFILCM